MSGTTTTRPSAVVGVFRSEVWTAVRDLEDREEVRDVLDYYLGEAAHEADTDAGSRALARAGDRLRTDLLYLERLVEALRRRFEPALVEQEERERREEVRAEERHRTESLRESRRIVRRVERYRRSSARSSSSSAVEADNVVRVDFGRRAS